MKVVQIVAAPLGWFVKRNSSDGYMAGVACWALGDDGLVYPVIPEDGGVIVEQTPCSVYEPHQAYEYQWSTGKPPTDEDWEPFLTSEESVFWRKPHGAK